MNRLAAAILGMTAGEIFLLGGQPASATHPLGTEDPGTVAPKSVDGEITVEHDSGAEGTATGIGASLTTGVLENVDVTVSVPFLVDNPDEGGSESGVGDVELAAKWHFLAGGDGRPGLAIKGALTLPTGDEDTGLGSGEFDPSLALIAAFALDSVDVNVNLGYGRLNGADAEAGEKKDIYTASAAAEWAVAEPAALVGEVAWESAGADGDDPYVAATAGVVYVISDGLSVDAGVRVGLTDSAPDWSVLAGVNFGFGGE